MQMKFQKFFLHFCLIFIQFSSKKKKKKKNRILYKNKIKWDDVEIIEILELFAQVLKKFLNLKSYHSMKERKEQGELKEEGKEEKFLIFKLKYDPKLYLNVFETIYKLDIIKSSSLFAISYLTIILQNENIDGFIKKSTNHILDGQEMN